MLNINNNKLLQTDPNEQNNPKTNDELVELKNELNIMKIKYNQLLIEKGNLFNECVSYKEKLNFFSEQCTKMSNFSDERAELSDQVYQLKKMMMIKEKENEEMKQILNDNIERFKAEKNQILSSAEKMANEKYKTIIQDLDNDYLKLNKENDKLKENFLLLENKYFEVEKENRNFNDKIDSVKEKLKISEELYNNFLQTDKEKYRSILEKNSQLNKENVEYSEEIVKKQKELEEMQEKYNFCYQDLMNTKSVKESVENMNKKFEEKIFELEVEKNKLEIENKSLYTQIKVINEKSDQDIFRLSREILLLKEAKTNLNDELDKYKFELRKQAESNNELSNQYNQDKYDKNDLNSKISTLTQENLAHELKIKALKETVEEFKKKNLNLTDIVSNLKEELFLTKQNNYNLLQQHKDDVLSLTKLRTERNDNRLNTETIYKKISLSKEKIRENKDLQIISNDLSDLLYKTSTPENYIERLTEELEEIVKVVNLRNEKIDECNGKVYCTGLEKENLIEQIKALDKKLKEKEEEIALQKENYKSLLDSKHKIEETLLEIRNENNMMKETFEKQKNSISFYNDNYQISSEIISQYEIHKDNLESLLVKTSKFLRNKNLQNLISDFTKASYDYFIYIKEGNKDEKESKRLEIDFILKNISKELGIEKRMYDLESASSTAKVSAVCE